MTAFEMLSDIRASRSGASLRPVAMALNALKGAQGGASLKPEARGCPGSGGHGGRWHDNDLSARFQYLFRHVVQQIVRSGLLPSLYRLCGLCPLCARRPVS